MKIHYNIYWLRAIACVSVVLIHAISSAIKNHGLHSNEVSQYLQLFLMFATPSFIIISEFLISNRYPNKLPSNFFTKRIQLLLLPYVSMGLIFAFVFTDSLSLFLNELLFNIMLADYVGYFVIIILQFYILNHVFNTFLSKIKPTIYLSIAFLINIVYTLFFQITVPPDIILADYIWGRGYFILFPAWLFYFVFGYFLGTNYEKIRPLLIKYRFLISALFIANAVQIFSFKYFDIIGFVSSKRIDILTYAPLTVLFILSIFVNSKSIPIPISVINKYSFNIYLLHLLLIDSLPKITHYFWLDIAIYFSSGLIFTIIFSKILSRLKISKYIIGNRLNIRT